MKQFIFILLLSISLFGCTDSGDSLAFSTIPSSAFHPMPMQLPADKAMDSLKRAHDSCMGFLFDANALLLQTDNRFFVGAVLNRRTLQVVHTLKDIGIGDSSHIISNLTVATNPCYEKRVLTLPLRSLLGNGFVLNFTATSAAVNKELNDAVAASGNAQMQTGSWVYLDIAGALQRILDTAEGEQVKRYRHDALDTSNMILTATENITDISFAINTATDMSPAAQAFLQTKPTLPSPDRRVWLQLYYISNRQFQMSLNGFFPVIGRFAKAEIK